MGVIRWPELAWKDFPLCRLTFHANRIVFVIKHTVRSYGYRMHRWTAEWPDDRMHGWMGGRMAEAGWKNKKKTK